MNALEESAQQFATMAHEGTRRRYTDEPYIVHPQEVASIVATVPHTSEMIAAAWLHDVVEDCGVTFVRLESIFGPVVTDLVRWLSDTTTLADGKRSYRKSIERERMSHAPIAAKTVKLADLISNTRSIVAHDRKFAKVYLVEKAALLEVLGDGDTTLYGIAARLVVDSCADLGIHLESSHGH